VQAQQWLWRVLEVVLEVVVEGVRPLESQFHLKTGEGESSFIVRTEIGIQGISNVLINFGLVFFVLVSFWFLHPEE
jgi:hypothetical protein